MWKLEPVTVWASPSELNSCFVRKTEVNSGKKKKLVGEA